CKSQKVALLQLVNLSLGGKFKLKLFNEIRIENRRNKLPGNVEENRENGGLRSNKKLEDWSSYKKTTFVITNKNVSNEYAMDKSSIVKNDAKVKINLWILGVSK
ncbi:4010_t:CDS:2, partial [Dentiscutata erythropus]